MFEGTYQAPYYNDLYGFKNGAQNDIFFNGQIASTADLNTPPHTPITTRAAAVVSSSVAAITSQAPAPTTTPAAPQEPAPTHAAPAQDPAQDPEPTPEGENSPTSSASSPASTLQW